MQLPLDEYAEVTRVRETLQSTVVDMRNELDEQLDSINQNTVEIQNNYDYLDQLDKRMDKIESKLDQLSFLLSQNVPKSSISLTAEEKEIFFALYTSQEPLSFEELAHRTGIETFIVEDFITSLQIKSIPIDKKEFAGKVFVLLPEQFKQKQAKERLIAA